MNTSPLRKYECDVLAHYLDRLLAVTPPELRLPIQQVRGLVLAARTLADDEVHSVRADRLERAELRLIRDIEAS